MNNLLSGLIFIGGLIYFTLIFVLFGSVQLLIIISKAIHKMKTLILLLFPVLLQAQLITDTVKHYPCKLSKCDVCEKEIYLLDDSGIGNKIFPFETSVPDSLVGDKVRVVKEVNLCRVCWDKYWNNSDIEFKIHKLWMDYWKACYKEENKEE